MRNNIPQGCGSIHAGSRIIAHGGGTFKHVLHMETNLLNLPGILANILQSTKFGEDITFEQHIVYPGRQSFKHSKAE
jgi:hypothetical protein